MNLDTNYTNYTAEDFESFEQYEDYVKGKKGSAASAAAGSRSSLPKALLNIKVVNNTGAAQVLELFNPNASVALVNNPAVSALNPFTAADVVALNTNNLIYFNRVGNLIYDVAAGLMTTSVTNNGVSYRQLFESCKTMRFRIEKCMYSFSNNPQADNGINFFYKSTFGKQSNNEITPSSYKDPINPQTQLLDCRVNWLIDCESGLQQTINIGETVGFSMFMNNIERGLVWPK